MSIQWSNRTIIDGQRYLKMFDQSICTDLSLDWCKLDIIRKNSLRWFRICVIHWWQMRYWEVDMWLSFWLKHYLWPRITTQYLYGFYSFFQIWILLSVLYLSTKSLFLWTNRQSPVVQLLSQHERGKLPILAFQIIQNIFLSLFLSCQQYWK